MAGQAQTTPGFSGQKWWGAGGRLSQVWGDRWAQYSKCSSSGPSPLFKMDLSSTRCVPVIDGSEWVPEWLEFFYSLEAYHVLSTCVPIISASQTILWGLNYRHGSRGSKNSRSLGLEPMSWWWLIPQFHPWLCIQEAPFPPETWDKGSHTMLRDSLVYSQTQVHVPYTPVITYHTEVLWIVSLGLCLSHQLPWAWGPCQIIFLAPASGRQAKALVLR